MHLFADIGRDKFVSYRHIMSLAHDCFEYFLTSNKLSTISHWIIDVCVIKQMKNYREYNPGKTTVFMPELTGLVVNEK